MSYLQKILTSRSFWTLIAMFFVGGINAIIPVLPSSLQTLLMALLAPLAMYFHTSPSTTYNLPADGTSRWS